MSSNADLRIESAPATHTDTDGKTRASEELCDSGEGDEQGDMTLPYSRFSTLQRNIIVVIIAYCGILNPFAQGSYYPVIQRMADDFNVSLSKMNLTIAVFQYSAAVFPLIWGNIAERYGRRYVYIATMTIFVAVCAGCAVSNNINLLIGLRVLQSASSSSVISVGAGTISDIFEREKRGTAMGIYLMGMLLGLPLAPIVGGAVGQHLGWRAIFWMKAIMGGVGLILVLFMLPETHRRIVAKKYEFRRINILPKLTLRENNPLQTIMYVRNPAVAIIVFHITMIFGVCITIGNSNTYVMDEVYSLSETATGLTYIGLETGSIIGTVVGGWFVDFVLKRERMRKQKELGLDSAEFVKVAPEVRIKYIWTGAIVYVGSVIGYGWMAHVGTVPLAGVIAMQVLVGFMMDWQLVECTNYLVDLFPARGASIIAAQAFYRAIWCGVCAQVLITIRDSIGWGWEFTIFGGLCAVSFVATLLVSYRGEKLRGVV